MKLYLVFGAVFLFFCFNILVTIRIDRKNNLTIPRPMTSANNTVNVASDHILSCMVTFVPDKKLSLGLEHAAETAIRSYFRFRFEKAPLTVVDDGSGEIFLKRLEDLRQKHKFDIVRRKKNGGVSMAKNTCLRLFHESKSMYLFIFEQDVEFLRSGWQMQYIRLGLDLNAHHMSWIGEKWLKEEYGQWAIVGRRGISPNGYPYLVAVTYTGQLSFFTRVAVSLMGGMVILPQRWGHAHVMYTERAKRMGIAKELYDIPDGDSILRVLGQNVSVYSKKDKERSAAENWNYLKKHKVDQYVGWRPFIEYPEQLHLQPEEGGPDSITARPGSRIGVCIHGQLSRMEIESKLKHIIEPLKRNHVEVDVVVILSNSSESTNDMVRSGPWEKRSLIALKQAFLDSGASRINIEMKSPPETFLFDPKFVEHLDKPHQSHESRMRRHQIHLRQYWAVSKCADQFLEWNSAYDEIVKLREDTLVVADVPLGQRKFHNGVHFLNCQNFDGINEKHFAGDGYSMISLLRRLFLDYYRFIDEYFQGEFNETKSLGRGQFNIETFYAAVSKRMRLKVHLTSPDTLPFVIFRTGEGFVKAEPNCIPCGLFRNFPDVKVKWHVPLVELKLEKERKRCKEN